MKNNAIIKATAAFVLALTVVTAPTMQTTRFLTAEAITADEAGISVTGKLVPAGNLAQGKPFVISGNISSKNNITQVYGGVYSSDGSKSVIYCSDTPNTKTYNLSTKFDNTLTFNTLAAGQYVYRISVNAGNNDVVLIESPFTVGNGGSAPAATSSAGITVSGKIAPTGNLTQGKPYIIGGIISSGNTITQVYGGVYSSDGSKSILYCSDTPNATSYDLRKKFDNTLTFNTLANGNYLYKVVAKTASGESVVAESQFTVGGGAAQNTNTSSGVSVSGKIVPTGNLTQGKPYIIGGIISSGNTITQVYGGVYSSDGSKSILYCSDTPNATSYDLRKKFDNTLTFNLLANGNYLYKVVAKTTSGETVVAESQFTVGGGAAQNTNTSSGVSVSGKIVPTGNLTQGKPYIIGGIISSGNTITQVYGGVYSSDGSKSILYCSDTPNATSYDLRKKFDNTLTFNTLANGNYLYKVVAKTASGETVVAESQFTVGGGAAQNTNTSSGVTVSGKIAPTGSITQGKPYIIGGIISSGNTITQVYGGVYSSDGSKSILYCSDTPNATSYDLRKKFDNTITFNTLAKGSYLYKVIAKTASGETVVAESQFNIV